MFLDKNKNISNTQTHTRQSSAIYSHSVHRFAMFDIIYTTVQIMSCI